MRRPPGTITRWPTRPRTVEQAAAEARAFAAGPLCRGARKGADDQPGGARFGRPADERADRACRRSSSRTREPARRPVGASARSCCATSADRRPLRLALHRRRSRCRRRRSRLSTRPTWRSAAHSSARCNSYLAHDLGYQTDMPYRAERERRRRFQVGLEAPGARRALRAERSPTRRSTSPLRCAPIRISRCCR